MSRCCCKREKEVSCNPVFMPMPKSDNCCCSFPTLIILILIILQFSKKGKGHDDYKDSCEKGGLIDNGILFIIALFYLACCGAGCGKGYGA